MLTIYRSDRQGRLSFIEVLRVVILDVDVAVRLVDVVGAAGAAGGDTLPLALGKVIGHRRQSG